MNQRYLERDVLRLLAWSAVLMLVALVRWLAGW